MIGTHRLLQATTRFKDLGLVIVDEEQRFGVEHKEHLKSVARQRRCADAVGNAHPAHPGDGGDRHPRDVDDPDAPGGAAPGADFCRAYDEKQIGAAIRRELLRKDRCSTCTTASNRSSGGSANPRTCAGGPHRGRPRTDGRRRARTDHRRLLGQARSTSWSAPRSSSQGIDIAQRQHVDRRAWPTCWAWRSCTSCAAASGGAAIGPTRTSSTHRRGR